MRNKRGISAGVCIHCPLHLMCMLRLHVPINVWCYKCNGWVLQNQKLIVACSKLSVITYMTYKDQLLGHNSCPNCMSGHPKYGTYTIIRPWQKGMSKLIFANKL